jgi:hypothetical protein
MIRNVLALEDHDPICGPCTAALGGQSNGAVIASPRVCRHCGNIRDCAGVGEFTWPAALIRPRHDGKPWANPDPDNYDELETILGRRG